MSSLKRTDIVIVILCFAASLARYAQTLAQGLLYGDSAEFQTIAYTMGIGHPTGYPVYVAVAKIFTMLVPFGEIAYCVNLFSAFSAAVSIALTYLIARKLDCEPVPAVFAALILSLIPLFWRYISIAEVNIFSSPWIALLLFSILSWSESK